MSQEKAQIDAGTNVHSRSAGKRATSGVPAKIGMELGSLCSVEKLVFAF